MPARLQKDTDSTAELIRDFMIVQLGIAGVPQTAIRKILGVDMNRVNRIVKLLKKPE